MTDDPLRPAFEALRAAAMPEIRPPGVDATVRTVRRRRTVRRLGAGAPVLAALVALVALPLPSTGDGRPPVPDTSLAGTPEQSPSSSASASGSPTAGATGAVGTPGVDPTTTARRTSSPTPTGCRPHGRLINALPAPDIFVVELVPTEARPLCPGESKDFFWASYAGDGYGNWTLFASERHTATAANPRVEGPKRNPSHGGNFCVALYFVEGRGAIVPSFTGPGGTTGGGPYAARLLWGGTTTCTAPPTPG